MKPTRNSLFLAIALAMALLLAAAWPCAAKAPDPMPTDLGVLYSSGHSFSEAHAINNAGQVVGASFGADTNDPQPFVWQNDVMTQLPLPEGFTQGVAMSINDAGQVAGYCNDVDSHYQACLWTHGAGGWVVESLGAPTFTYPETEREFIFPNSIAGKINNAGQVLAMAWGMVYEGATNDFYVGAIWQNGAWSFLTRSDGVPQDGFFWLFKMNENGQVLFTKETADDEDYEDLWVWDGGTASQLVERIDCANLNNLGQIVGSHYDFSRKENINFTYDISSKELTTSPLIDAGYSLVNINDKGQILVAYLTTREWYENGYLTATTELGITSFEDWSPATASVTSLGSVDDGVDPHSLNFNVNGEVSGHGYYAGNIFYASEAAGVMSLTGLVVEDDTALEVTAMNNSGVIIGRAKAPDSGVHAVLWGEVAPPVSTLDILIDPSGPVPINTPIDSGAFLSNSQTTDIHTATWDWGDGSTPDGTIDNENKIVTGAHSYAEPGVYTVALEIFDSEKGLLSKAVYQYMVVYDPVAGFVTGGGWFNSPAGAYKNDTSMQGQATFGFVSRYKKGATVPTGNTAFGLTTGDLYFQSTSYEWLVVTGSDQARFKGSGTINGGGDYKFVLWAGDSNPDTFRIRIWEEDEETAEEKVIYDNGFDQAINGGSIVIHTN
jgi:probable HAF family extracellular repeat protein